MRIDEAKLFSNGRTIAVKTFPPIHLRSGDTFTTTFTLTIGDSDPEVTVSSWEDKARIKWEKRRNKLL